MPPPVSGAGMSALLGPLRSPASRRGGTAYWLAGLVACASLLPLAFILWIAAQTGASGVASLLLRKRVAELLTNTLALEICAVPPACALALALAWLTERSDLPGAGVWSLVAVAPLAVPAFVQSYAWVSLLPRAHGLPMATLVSVLAYYPFVYLPLAAQFRRLDPALEEAAASLGRGPWRVFAEVVIPQLRIALCGGALLVALHLLGEYGLYAMIGFDTFTTAIVDQFQSAYDGPAANLMGGVLVLCCATLLGVEAMARSGARFARIGPGAARTIRRARLGPWRLPALALALAVAGLALGVPLLTLGRWTIVGGAATWAIDGVGDALAQTIGLAAAGAILATILALPMAWISVRRPSRLSRALEACHYYVGSLPGIIVALALVAVTIRVARPLYQTLVTILLAYALIFLPRALVGIRASLAQAPVELEHAANALGRSPAHALLTVTARLIAPGLAAAMALVGLGITNELTATLLLAPNGTRTLATEFWSWSTELDYARAAPYAVAMVALSMPMAFILHTQSRRAAGR